MTWWGWAAIGVAWLGFAAMIVAWLHAWATARGLALEVEAQDAEAVTMARHYAEAVRCLYENGIEMYEQDGGQRLTIVRDISPEPHGEGT